MYTIIKPTSIIDGALTNATAEVTVARVVNVLSYQLQSRNDAVIFRDEKFQVHELGEKPELCNLPADRVKITFCGGPPGAYKVYKGTVLSYLMDRIVWEEVHGNSTILNVLQDLLKCKFSFSCTDWMIFDDAEALCSS